MYENVVEISRVSSSNGLGLSSPTSKRYTRRLGKASTTSSLLTPPQFVEPQRKVADLIVPRGIENRVALGEYYS
jgi:hypothetical protein